MIRRSDIDPPFDQPAAEPQYRTGGVVTGVTVPIEPTPRETGDHLRRLGREMREVHAELARRAEATAELDAVAGGLDPDQECRARAALAAATALGPAIAKQAGDTFDVDADVADMASWLAGYIRDGSVPR